MKHFFVALLLILLNGCAVAPFATDHSGATLGEGKNAIDTGFSPAPYFQYGRGISDKFDLAGGIEVQLGYSVFMYGKYNLYTKHTNGLSLSMLGGAGLGFSYISSKFIFTGPIASYRKNAFEIFLHPRYNVLMYDKFSLTDDRVKGFDVDGGSFDYFLLAAGAQYYFTPSFALGLSVVARPPAPGDPIYVAPGISALLRF